MYLYQLHIHGFRRFADTHLRFNDGQKVFVGPNSVRKTAVVDSLRVSLSERD